MRTQTTETTTTELPVSESRQATWYEEQLESAPSGYIIVDVDPNDIVIDPARNSRPTPDVGSKELKELINEIDALGFNQVPGLADLDASGFPSLYAGFRRARSIQTLRKAGGKILFRLIVSKERLDPKATLVRSLGENTQRQDMNLLEKAVALVTLMKEHDMPMKEAAAVMRMSPAQASVTARIQFLPDVTKKAIKAGNCTYRAVEHLISQYLPKQTDIAADETGGVLAKAQEKIAELTTNELAAHGEVLLRNLDSIARKTGAGKADGKKGKGEKEEKGKRQRTTTAAVAELGELIEAEDTDPGMVETLKAFKKWLEGGSTKAFVGTFA